ncbi:MAG: DUF6542 domain-containing protein [Pseudonocardia sp.]
MTTSDRPPASARNGPGFPMRERSSIATVLGLPPAAAFGLGAGGTVLGVLIDILRIGTVGGVFTAFYFMGCVLAVAWVRRRNLFGPMVAPPLLLAAVVPAVVLLAAPPRPGSGITEQLIAVGAPLVNAFPQMATTSAIVVALGVARILLQPIAPPGSTPLARLAAVVGRGRAARV